MYLEESIRQANINNIKMIFILATIFLLIALVQKLKPTFSLTYQSNSKPSYVKAKLISKLITSATLYICGVYFYYFTDLTLFEASKDSYLTLVIPILGYHVYVWGLTKLFDFRNKKSGINP